MIGENIFNLNNQILRNEKENEEYWTNIKDIYDIFHLLILNEEYEPNILEPYIDKDFLNNLIKLFDSNFDEEKNILKRIMHKIYKKIIHIRKTLREIISNYLNDSIIILSKVNGAKELLEIMSSIISGFSIPLKEEHIIFFKNIIIPLHHKKAYDTFYYYLAKCVILFLKKDKSLSNLIIDKILEYFSFHDFNTKILFLKELKEILDFSGINSISSSIEKLLNIIVECFSEFNISLREEALSLFDEEIFISIIKKYINISYNIIVPKIYYFKHNPWNNKSKLSFIFINHSLKKYDLRRYNNALKIKLNNEMKILPENKDEEKRQIKLALKLSENDGKYKLNNPNKNKLIFRPLEYTNIIVKKKYKRSNTHDYKLRIKDKKEEQFDEDFGICPITQEFMKHPVLCPSGNYYEKSAILDWLKKHDTDPLTRQHLTAYMLMEDKDYRKKIREYRIKFNK